MISYAWSEGDPVFIVQDVRKSPVLSMNSGLPGQPKKEDIKAMNTMTADRQRLNTRDIVYTGIFAALIAVCSWISIPTAVPFTLQTFAVFMAVLVLGGKRGTLAVVVYIILGAVGVPVFANFTGGFGILLGSTGGYIAGFILTALIMWGMERICKGNAILRIVSMLLGLLACYTAGTIWFMAVYSRANGAISVMTALSWCVFPFIIPDLVKIAIAYIISPSIRKAIHAN